MFLTFRQGTAKSNNDFLVPSGLNVTFDPTSGASFSAAHLNGVNYYLDEKAVVPNAWTLSDATRHYLFIDINAVTGVKTFGTTKIPPVSQNSEPATPVDGLLWFDLTNGVMKVYSNSRFSVVVRVVVGTIENNITNYYPIGSNVGVSSSQATFKHGTIMRDSTGRALRNEAGTFITTETKIHTVNAFGETLTLEAHTLIGIAAEQIQTGDVVSVAANLDIIKTEYTKTFTSLLAIALNDANIGQEVNLTLQGVVSNNLWDWIDDPGTMLWVDNGQLTNVDPFTLNSELVRQPPIARVVDNTTVWFESSLGTTPHSHIASEIVMDVPVNGAVDAQHAIEILDNTKVDRTGDTMTGYLVLVGDPETANQAATKQYVDDIALERLNDVTVSNIQLGDVLTNNGVFWTNAPPAPVEIRMDNQYVTVDVDTLVITNGITWNVDIPTLKINIDSDSLQGNIISGTTIGSLDINLSNMVDDHSYYFNIVVEHIGTAGDVYVDSYVFDKTIKWVNGIPPTVLPFPYHTLLMRFVSVPMGEGYTICGEWTWHASDFAIANNPIPPFIPFTSPYHQIDPKPIVLSDGTLMIVYAKYDNTQPNTMYGTVESMRSTDGGHTWVNAGTVFSGLVDSIQVPIYSVSATVDTQIEIDTVYVAVGYSEPYQTLAEAAVFYSSDVGASWTLEGTRINTNDVVGNHGWHRVTVDIKLRNIDINNPQNNVIVLMTVGDFFDGTDSRVDIFIGPSAPKGQLVPGLTEGIRGTVNGDYLYYIAPVAQGNDTSSDYHNLQIYRRNISDGIHALDTLTPIQHPLVGEYDLVQFGLSVDIAFSPTDNSMHVVTEVFRTDLFPRYYYTQLVHWASFDGGVTWSAPSYVSGPVLGDENRFMFDSGVKMNIDSIGRIHLDWYRRSIALDWDPGTQNQYFLYTNSDDNGVTWGEAQIMDVPSNCDTSLLDYQLDFVLEISRGNMTIDSTANENIFSAFSIFNPGSSTYELYFTKLLNNAIPQPQQLIQRPGFLPDERFTASTYNQVPTATVLLPDFSLLNFVIEFNVDPYDYNNQLNCYRSIDDGDTWTFVSTVADVPGVSTAYVDADINTFGDVHVTYLAYTISGEPTYGLYHATSTDGGTTWSLTGQHYSFDGDVSSISMAIDTSSDFLHAVVVAWSVSDNSNIAKYMYSGDGGLTWSQGGGFIRNDGEISELITGISSAKIAFVPDAVFIIHSVETGTWIFKTSPGGELNTTDVVVHQELLLNLNMPFEEREDGFASTRIAHKSWNDSLALSPIKNTILPGLNFRARADLPNSSVGTVWTYVDSFDLEGRSIREPFSMPASLADSGPGFGTTFEILNCDLLIDWQGRSHAVALVKYTTGAGKYTTSVLYTNRGQTEYIWGQQIEQPVVAPNVIALNGNNLDSIRSQSFKVCFDGWGNIIVTFALHVNNTMQSHRVRFEPFILPPRVDIPPFAYFQPTGQLSTTDVLISNSNTGSVNYGPLPYGNASFVLEIEPNSLVGTVNLTVVPNNEFPITIQFFIDDMFIWARECASTMQVDPGVFTTGDYPYDITATPTATIKLMITSTFAGGSSEGSIDYNVVSMMLSNQMDATTEMLTPTITNQSWTNTNVGGFLIVGGGFNEARNTIPGYVGPYNQPETQNIARWNGTHWNMLATGGTHAVNVDIRDMCYDAQGKLWMVGGFTEIGGVNAPGIVMYDPVNDTWTAGPDPNAVGSVDCIVFDAYGDMYIGGDFTSVDGVADTRGVAKWNGTQWVSIAPPFSSFGWSGIARLHVMGDALFVSGGFSSTIGGYGHNLVQLAISTGTWSTVGGGVNGIVHDFEEVNGELLMCGSFSGVRSVLGNPAIVPNTAGLAKYSGGVMMAVGVGNAAASSNTQRVLKYDANADILYIGGSSSGMGGVTSKDIITLTNNFTTWVAVPGIVANFAGVNDILIRNSNEVYVAGGMQVGNGDPGEGMAMWNGTSWVQLDRGLTGYPKCMAIMQLP